MESSVGQPLQSIESSWTLSSIDDEESNPIELSETEKKRDIRLKEFEDAVRICKENDVVLSETLLRKVLLHPGDDGTIRDVMQLPPPGSSLSKDFWKISDEKKRRRKKSKISSADTTTTESAVRKKATTNLITFPKLRDVTPERHHVNLSTGRALVGRKVDCWLTFEEYERLTSTLEPTIRRERPIPNAFWPGHLMDKLRLCLSPCTSHPLPACDAARSKNTSFYQVKKKPHNGHRANYGYDNNEKTWPTDGKYVKYGNVDSRKVYHI
uniref:EF-hand calcium-binding domain-containing protein 12-like isoform X2 n=1 Tax=Ciona intestinalis TaxID=7719 RepID=UPI00089DBEBF|nr:EF-hand calcium-binding domain-containing protein 12-like isoform X2 [Ciona intestinalis]|eukprot:XP_009862249.2 EF-hand calcium-binding domain-containing protein 12-like isoform X2 [Ciona intestinalis]